MTCESNLPPDLATRADEPLHTKPNHVLGPLMGLPPTEQ
jgi:phage portal protein BeeE